MREHNLDGASTEYFPVEPTPDRLLGLLRAVFEEHWPEVVFGPCIQGAVFEARFTKPPRLTLNDGCVTVGAGPAEPRHLHLCIGPHRGTTRRPTPPELARWRRCARLDADTMRPVRVADWSRLAGVNGPPRAIRRRTGRAAARGRDAAGAPLSVPRPVPGSERAATHGGRITRAVTAATAFDPRVELIAERGGIAIARHPSLALLLGGRIRDKPANGG